VATSYPEVAWRSRRASAHPPERQERQVVAARRAAQEVLHVGAAGGEEVGEGVVLDAAEDGGGAADAVLLLVGRGLGPAIGVEEEGVAGGELEVPRGVLGLAEEAERETAALDRRTPRRSAKSGRGWPAFASSTRPPP
jgi:hypothetical protein